MREIAGSLASGAAMVALIGYFVATFDHDGPEDSLYVDAADALLPVSVFVWFYGGQNNALRSFVYTMPYYAVALVLSAHFCRRLSWSTVILDRLPTSLVHAVLWPRNVIHCYQSAKRAYSLRSA